MNYKFIIILLLVLIILILNKIISLIKQNNKKENYYYAKFSGLSSYEKAVHIANKIQEAIDYYNLMKENIPNLKEILSTITHWDKLKPKICEWASKNQLLTGILALIENALSNQEILKKQKLVNALTKVKTLILRLLSAVAVAQTFSTIASAIPSDLVQQINSKITLFLNIDKNVMDLLVKVPGFGTCSI
jgi:hypothetical protein